MNKKVIEIYSCTSCQGPQDISHLEKVFENQAVFKLEQSEPHTTSRYCCLSIYIDNVEYEDHEEKIPSVDVFTKLLEIE